MKYDVVVSSDERAVTALSNVYRGTLRTRRARGSRTDVVVTVDDCIDFLVRWLPVGWPRQVGEALHDEPRPDILVAPLMSPGARKAAADAGVGWVDESGAADIYYRDASSGKLIVIQTKGVPPAPLDTRLGWRPATLAVCEAILADVAAPTVSSVVAATAISVGSATTALKFLEKEGYLASGKARGPESARQIIDRDDLLDAYAAAADRLRSPISIRVGVLWRDPIAGTIETGRLWGAARITWAATSALSASQFAPIQTEISPLEIYVSGRTWGDVRRAALAAGMQEIQGGRLMLRPFPTPAGATLTEQKADGFHTVLWPRVYADLRTTGVRGEDAAEHVREAMTT